MSRIVFILFLTLALAARPGLAHAAIGLTLVSNTSFGTAMVPTPKPTTGTHLDEMGTNGAITYATGFSGPATGIAGEIQVTGPVGTTVTLSCSSAANVGTLTNNQPGNGSTTITVSAIRFSVGTTGAPGTGTLCAGTGTNSATMTINAVASKNIVYFGWTISVTNVKIGYPPLATGYTNTGVFSLKAVGSGGNGTVTLSTLTASAAFQDSLTLSNVQNINYGDISAIAPYTTSSVSMGTNGTATYAGNFSAVGGVVSPGQVTVSGVANGSALDVVCDASATLTNSAGTSSIKVTGIEVHTTTNRAAYGGGNCTGAGTITGTMDYSTTNNVLWVGGKLDGSTAVGALSGLYSTVNPGGTPATVTITLQ